MDLNCSPSEPSKEGSKEKFDKDRSQMAIGPRIQNTVCKRRKSPQGSYSELEVRSVFTSSSFRKHGNLCDIAEKGLTWGISEALVASLTSSNCTRGKQKLMVFIDT